MADDPQYVYNFAVRPLILLVAVGVILLLMRWAFTPGGGIVPRRRAQFGPPDYGLLEQVATVDTVAEAEEIRALLAEVGVRATVAPGPPIEILVFRDDAERARAALSQT